MSFSPDALTYDNLRTADRCVLSTRRATVISMVSRILMHAVGYRSIDGVAKLIKLQVCMHKSADCVDFQQTIVAKFTHLTDCVLDRRRA